MKTNKESKDFPRNLSRSITFLNRQKVKFMNDKLREYNLIGAMYMILLHVAREPGTSQDAIVNHLHIDKCTIARRTKKLEELGYIYREVNEHDRRQNNLYPTEKGKEAVPVIKGFLWDWSRSITENFSDEEKDTLVSLLQKIINNCDR